jgi:hypothetical protein
MFTDKVQAFVLSLDGNCRNAMLIPRLVELGIKYQIISGIGPEQALQYVNGKEMVRNIMTPSQMACTLGHRSMHEVALKSSADWFIFLEDDATLESEFTFPIGSCGGIVKKKPIANLGSHEVFLFKFNGATGSHAYLADRSATSDMLQASYGLPRLPDSFSRSSSLDLCVVLPFLSYQDSGGQTFIPLVSSRSESKVLRKILSSLKADFLDLYHFQRFGARTFRLRELEKVVRMFVKILPGCDVNSPR